MTSRALLWCHRIPLYKTPRMACRGFLPHLGLRVHLTLVQSSTAGYSCMLGLTCWCVPASGACFLQLYLIGLLLLWASPQALTPRNAPTHPVSVISSTSRAIHTGLTSFWLVPMSTIPAVQVYIFGSVSPPGQHILPHGQHHIYIYLLLLDESGVDTGMWSYWLAPVPLSAPDSPGLGAVDVATGLLPLSLGVGGGIFGKSGRFLAGTSGTMFFSKILTKYGLKDRWHIVHFPWCMGHFWQLVCGCTPHAHTYTVYGTFFPDVWDVFCIPDCFSLKLIDFVSFISW